MPAACGSSSSSRSRPISSSPGTPFAVPRRWSSSRRGNSSGEVATTTFPHRLHGMPRSSQYASSAAAPATQSRAFSDPGA
jgi:hypothetical protein